MTGYFCDIFTFLGPYSPFLIITLSSDLFRLCVP